MSQKNAPTLKWYSSKLVTKQTYMKTEAYKLYSRVFWIFLPNVIKIDPCNFELYRFKVGAFFRHSVVRSEPPLDKLLQLSRVHRVSIWSRQSFIIISKSLFTVFLLNYHVCSSTTVSVGECMPNCWIKSEKSIWIEFVVWIESKLFLGNQKSPLSTDLRTKHGTIKMCFDMTEVWAFTLNF